MQVSVNTAVFLTKLQAGTSQATCLKSLIGAPIDAIEVRGEFFQAATKAAELTAIDQLCQQEHWDFYYSVPEELFTEDGLNAELPQTLAMARKYHIKSLKYSSGQLTDSAAIVAQLNELNFDDVQVTIENQPNDNGSLTTMTKLLTWVATEHLPLGYTFDSGNWYWIDQQPEPAFDQVKDKITVFHLKDIANQDTVLLGQGATDWQQLLAGLSAGTPVFLEYAIDDQDMSGQIELVNAALK